MSPDERRRHVAKAISDIDKIVALATGGTLTTGELFQVRDSLAELSSPVADVRAAFRNARNRIEALITDLG